MKNFTKSAIAYSANAGLILPFVELYSRVIRPLTESGQGAGPALLALQPERFRGDLTLLSEQSPFRVLQLPFQWQMRLLMTFYSRKVGGTHGELVFRPSLDPEVERENQQLRRFLAKFLPRLYRRLNIVGVVGTAVHYWRDVDWGAVSKDCGVPYIVLHRENLATRSPVNDGRYDRETTPLPTSADYTINRLRRWAPFQGNAIITHNEVMRDIFIKSGFVQPNQVRALGAMRMDAFVEHIKSLRVPAQERRSTAVLFSFTDGATLVGMESNWSPDGKMGWVRLSDAVHGAFAQLAVENPHRDFVIKVKWIGNTTDRIRRSIAQIGIDIESIPNLRITEDAKLDDLLQQASVVVGFGSTALLEAALAAKAVIVPIFEEAGEDFYAQHVPYADDLEIFDVVRSRESLMELVLRRLDEPWTASEELMARRAKAFEKFVSPTSPVAVQNYVDYLAELCGFES